MRLLLQAVVLAVGLVVAAATVAGGYQLHHHRHSATGAFVENTSMNPCEDFYTYICESQYKNPDGTVSNLKSLVAEAQDNVVAKIKAILEDKDSETTFPFTVAKTFYKSCMNTERVNAEGIKPIESVLRELRGWPLIKEHAEYELVSHWQELHLFYSKIGVYPLFEISVNNDALKRTNTILLRQPKTLIKESLLHQSKTFYKYVDYIKTVAIVIANSSGSSIIEQEVISGAKQIAGFESELSKSMEFSDGFSELYKTIELKKFQNITDHITRDRNTLNWTNIINSMYHSTSSKLVTIDDTIEISALSYFPKLIQLLHRTPLRTIVNYIHWRFIHHFLPHTSKEMRNLFFEMRNLFHEPVKNLPRWRFCGFEPAFDNVIAHTFAKKYMPPQLEKNALRVLNDIKLITLQTIKRSFWLTQEEKEVAEQKILNMDFVLGIPDAIKNFSVINSYYQKLALSDNYFDNILILKKFNKMKEFEDMKNKDFKSSANNNFMKITTISSIGSAYEFFDNRVLIKVENLVTPLFHPDYPEFKKYGILGFVIAYEIMHAFNDADSIGIPEPRKHLYSEETKLKFWDKIECVINQYDNYYIPDPLNWEKHIYVNGERSAMENIADLAAIKIAFQAYRERSKKQGFLSIEDDEEFFASFASLLCRPELEEFYSSRFNLALRTLPRFRIIGSLSNTNEFAKSFSCPSGAQMNPETKCDFWN